MDHKKAQTIAQAFVGFFYSTKDVSKLAPVYKESSTLTWGVTSDGKSTEHIGKAIGAHLSSVLPKIERKARTLDVQVLDKSLLVMVCGDVKIGEEVTKFAETFQLVPSDASGKSFWIFNDIFRVSI
jgi:hypothetical protein